MPLDGKDFWGTVFRDNQRDLMRFLVRRLRSNEDAADVAQEAYLRVMRAPPSTDIQSPRAYLFRTAANLAINHSKRNSWQRAQQKILASEGGPDIGWSANPAPDALLQANESAALLEKAIMSLPEKTRQAFVMHRFLGLTYDEIAKRMGVSRSMVEKHIIQALIHCRRLLEG